MNEEQFKTFAERIISKDDTNLALRSAFRWKHYSIVSDGRIALMIDRAFESLRIAVDGQQTVAARLVDKILPEQRKAEYVRFDLDANLLGRAAEAAAQDIAPEMEHLRHHVADPHNPDDADSVESERFVLSRNTYVIMPNQKRSVVAGYYAGVIADVCKGRTVCTYGSRKNSNRPIYAKGDDWWLVGMPIRMDGRDRSALDWGFQGTAVADAKTGKLAWSHYETGPCPIFKMRFPKKSKEGV